MELDGPALFYVDQDYLKQMYKSDCKVSLKFGSRPYVGIITMIENRKYVIPLTSQTTKKREKNKYKKRSPLTTTIILDSNDEEIANILHNNMIPVYDEVIKMLDIDPEKDTYVSNEIRFIRKIWERIQEKAIRVYKDRYNTESYNYDFLVQMCCDFKKLELVSDEYKKQKSE